MCAIEASWMCVCHTGVVVLGAVAQLLLLPHDKLRQREPVRNLHCPVFHPLEDQVVHGVADWKHRSRATQVSKNVVGSKLGRSPSYSYSSMLTALQLHGAGLDVHGEVLQVHGAGEDESQPAGGNVKLL